MMEFLVLTYLLSRLVPTDIERCFVSTATLVSRIEETVRDYTAQFDALMSALRDQGEKDSDILRYLTFRLDFNDFHSSGNNLGMRF